MDICDICIIYCTTELYIIPNIPKNNLINYIYLILNVLTYHYFCLRYLLVKNKI
jgi:hypothetical protein